MVLGPSLKFLHINIEKLALEGSLRLNVNNQLYSVSLRDFVILRDYVHFHSANSVMLRDSAPLLVATESCT